MHPAFSVIFFTVASGAGYGLLALLGIFIGLDLIPAGQALGAAGFTLALGAVTLGLLSSTFHLGRPERSWRAFSQWRTSWLSREGVLAVVTYGPALLFAYGWILHKGDTVAFELIGGLTTIFALVTVYCTAMIYASLKTIRAWANPWTVAAYLVFAMMTGGLGLNVLVHVWGDGQTDSLTAVVLISLVAGFAVKKAYWRHIDLPAEGPDAGTATGLGEFGKVRLLDSPHTETNYLMREMGYRIARKHSDKLRRLALAFAFVFPLLLTGLSLVMPGGPATFLVTLAGFVGGLGMFMERWLFFAEARHVVTLYYGQDRV